MNEPVLPLKLAENHLLQVLLSRFDLTKLENGAFSLQIAFDESTPAIRHREAKNWLRENTGDFSSKAQRYQRELDAFLFEDSRESTYRFEDPDFLFRHGNGGSLVIARLEGKDYYCFNYRDIHPVGWNIATGGSDTREELLHPFQIVERELREELIIVDPSKPVRYIFDEEEVEKRVDHPDFDLAWRLWQPRFEGLGWVSFEKDETLPLKFIDGQDRLEITFDGKVRPPIDQCFLNINARDFGIEIDRVARIHLPDGAILCDGEIVAGRLLNSPIGLFEIDSFLRDFRKGATEFLPDIVFHGAERFEGRRIRERIDQFLEDKEVIRSTDDRNDYSDAVSKLDLCPVTRTVVRRYGKLLEQTRTANQDPSGDPEETDIFLSHATEDRALAEQIFKFLEENTDSQVFFAPQSNHSDPNFSRVIDQALDAAHIMVAVASKPELFEKHWPEYEWRRFHVDMMNGIKDQGRLITVISGFDARLLPGALRMYESVSIPDDAGFADSMQKLSKFL